MVDPIFVALGRGLFGHVECLEAARIGKCDLLLQGSKRPSADDVALDGW